MDGSPIRSERRTDPRVSYRVERIEDSLRGKVPLYISLAAARRSLPASRDERYVRGRRKKKKKSVGGWIGSS